MLRALTIRFIFMAVGLSALVLYLNAIEAAFGAALAAVILYSVVSSSIVFYYLGRHLDEIPVRDPHRRTHGT